MSSLTLERQLEIMQTQLSNFDDVLEKIQYMAFAFDPDPEFTQEARDIIRGKICQSMNQLNS